MKKILAIVLVAVAAYTVLASSATSSATTSVKQGLSSTDQKIEQLTR